MDREADEQQTCPLFCLSAQCCEVSTTNQLYFNFINAQWNFYMK